MRTQQEIEELLGNLVDAVDVTVKRRLDRSRLAGTIGMVSVLEWILGRREDHKALVELSQAELASAVRHANR